MTIRRPRVLTMVLAVVIAAAGSQQAHSQSKPCKDPMPKDCVKVKALGEDTNGCACFICNPEGPNRQVACTTDEVTKKKFRDLAAK